MHDIAALQDMIRTEYGESSHFVANYTPEQVEAWIQITCELHGSDAVTMTMIHALLGCIAELEALFDRSLTLIDRANSNTDKANEIIDKYNEIFKENDETIETYKEVVDRLDNVIETYVNIVKGYENIFNTITNKSTKE